MPSFGNVALFPDSGPAAGAIFMLAKPADTSRTVVIDGNNLAMRSLFAMRGHQTVLSSHGENTGPLLVFARMLDRYARFTQPDKLVVCWDSGESWRQMVDDGYKANRPAKPDDDESEKR